MKKSEILRESERKKIEKRISKISRLNQGNDFLFGIKKSASVTIIESPFLPPDLLEEYNKDYKGFAKDICEITKQVAHSDIENGKIYSNTQSKKILRGQIFGSIIIIIGLIVTTICVFKEAYTVASIVAGGSTLPQGIIQLLKIFKNGKKENDSEKENKQAT